jgi:hypothetical protein
LKRVKGIKNRWVVRRKELIIKPKHVRGNIFIDFPSPPILQIEITRKKLISPIANNRHFKHHPNQALPCYNQIIFSLIY